MKKEKGFMVPLLVVVGFLVIASVAYFHARRPIVALAPEIVSSSDENVSEGSSIVTRNSSVHTSAYLSGSQTISQKGEEFAQVTDQGTAAQRFNLQTFTNVDESYAISFPRSWYLSGSGANVFLTNGRSSISVVSQAVSSGTLATGFALQDGAATGFSTKAANAYDGFEVINGNTTTYYLVNGGVGYKLVLFDGGVADVLRQILLTFTYTKAR